MTATSPTIWVIEKTQHSRNQDNYAVEETGLEIDEGYFLTQEAAQQRANELGGPTQIKYQALVEQEKKAHQALTRSIRRHNKEAAAIRAAGMAKADQSLPEPYVPKTFQQFNAGQWSYISYGVEPLEPAVVDQD